MSHHTMPRQRLPLAPGLCLIIVLLTQPTPAPAQWFADSTFDTQIRRGIDHVYNLEFEEARREFRDLIKQDPEHPAGHFFLAMVEWWNILIAIDDESNDERFLGMLERVIDMCDRRLDENSRDLTALFFKGGAVGFRGRLYANREDWVKAANDGRIALVIVQDAYALAPENEDILFGIGIYNYYAAVIPERYPIVKPLMIFFPAGNKERGIEQLKRAAERASYAHIEAAYFSMQLLYTYERRFDLALRYAFDLHRRYPKNPVFHRYLGRCYASMGLWPEMKRTFHEVLDAVRADRIGYASSTEREAEYYLGIAGMNDSTYDTALAHFYRCDELSRSLDTAGPSGFMVMTNLKIGMIYDIQMKREQAKHQYRKVLGMNAYQDSHKLAEQHLSIPYGRQ